MKLYTINKSTKLPEFNDELYAIPCFRELIKTSYKRQKQYPISGDPNGRNKELAHRELLYIHFCCVYDSRFYMYEADEKIERIKSIVQLPDNWQPHDLLLECISVYTELSITPSLDLYISAREGIKKMKQFIDNYDPTEKTKAGTLVLKPKEFKDTIQDLDTLATNMNKLKKVIHEEQEESFNKRGGRRLKKFEE